MRKVKIIRPGSQVVRFKLTYPQLVSQSNPYRFSVVEQAARQLLTKSGYALDQLQHTEAKNVKAAISRNGFITVIARVHKRKISPVRRKLVRM